MDEGRQVQSFWVQGRVQGVGFRWHTRCRARELGLVGWVRNLADGRVEARAAGSPAQLVAFRDFLSRGPEAASVTGLEVGEPEVLDSRGLPDPFEIQR